MALQRRTDDGLDQLSEFRSVDLRRARHHTVLNAVALRLERAHIGLNTRCAECGKLVAQVMRDMKAHYAEMEAKSGFSARYTGAKG